MVLPWFGLDSAALAAGWEPALAGTPYRRVYVDLPGTGQSPAGEPRSDAIAAEVARTLNTVAGAGRGPVLLAGCSYGGYLAAAVARQHPRQVAALLMVCSGVRIRPADRDLAGVIAPVPEPGWLDAVPGPLREHFQHAVGHQTAAVAARMTDAFGRSAPADEPFLAELRETGYQLSGEAELPGLDTAATVVAGRQDQIAGYRDQFAFAAASPGRSEYLLLDQVGHYLPFEQPARFRAIVADWLARSDQPDAA